MSLLAVTLFILFLVSLFFLLSSLKRNSKSIILFSYLIGAVIVVSVIYVEWIAQPMPYVGEKEEKQLVHENKQLIKSIKENKVTNKQNEEFLIQTLKVHTKEELYINGEIENRGPTIIIKKSPTAKETTIHLFKLNTVFQHRQYVIPINTKLVFDEEESSLNWDEDNYLESEVSIISSSSFYLPYATYAEGMDNGMGEVKNEARLMIELIVPENIKIHRGY